MFAKASFERNSFVGLSVKHEGDEPALEVSNSAMPQQLFLTVPLRISCSHSGVTPFLPYTDPRHNGDDNLHRIFRNTTYLQ